MGVTLYGPAIALSSVTSLSKEEAIVLMGLICTVYTAIGGLKAVIWTDCVQYIMIVIALVVVAIKGTSDVGGMDRVFFLADEGNRLTLWK